MRITSFLLLVSSIFYAASISSCVSHKMQQEADEAWRERQRASAKKSQESLRELQKSLTPPAPTEKQLSDAKMLMVIYYRGLGESIAALDDGVSPADVVAQAAVQQNKKSLVAWKLKQTEHLMEVVNRLGEDYERKIRNGLPGRTHINEGTAIVLKQRRMKSE